jgi:hypothetical protein
MRKRVSRRAIRLSGRYLNYEAALICPTGKSVGIGQATFPTVQPACEKYFASPFARNSNIDFSLRASERRIATVTTWSAGYGRRR